MIPKSLNKWLSLPFFIFSCSEKKLVSTAFLLNDFSSSKSSNKLNKWNRQVCSLLNSIQHWVFDALEYRTTSKGPALLTSSRC